MEQQIGRLLEAIDDSKVDRGHLRDELRTGLAMVADRFTALTGELRQVAQVAQSTAFQMTNLIGQRLDTRMGQVERLLERISSQQDGYNNTEADRRLHELEGRLKTYEDERAKQEELNRYVRFCRTVLGTGVSFIARVVVALVGSGVLGTLIFKWLGWVH